MSSGVGQPRSANNSSLPEAVRNLVQERVDAAILSKYAVPDRVIVVEALEKTSVGKVNKRMLCERYAAS
jgi:fatty-acyl-CoA synthase